VIRPFTCVCLMLAAGSGLYLYQVKQRAFTLDASLRSTFHDIDEARDRTRMLRADWALMNDPERLQALAAQYLTLQPMQPAQLVTMDQLASTLPAPVPFSATPAPTAPKPAPVIDPTQGVPMAEVQPRLMPHTGPVEPEIALAQPPVAAVADPAPPVVAADPVPAPVPAPVASVPLPAPSPTPTLAALSPPAAIVAVPEASQAPAAPPHAEVADAAPSPKPAAPPKPAHHWVRHPSPESGTWLADANGTPLQPHRHTAHHPSAAPRQFFAANVPAPVADPTPRITPPAATVMYSPASGSSLGMAASAALAPPRPLYSTSQ
jgi:hypothetical protein